MRQAEFGHIPDRNNNMVMRYPIDAVVFDMDGLMIDTEPIYKRALQKAAEKFGRRLSDEFVFTLIGMPDPACRTAISGHLGPDFPMDAYWNLWPELWCEEAEENGIPRKPGLDELLSFLEQMGTPMAIATSSFGPQTEFSLRVSGLDFAFDHIVTGDQVENGKPAPDIFLEASRRLDVPPDRCLALEDSENGVRAAHSAGMVTIMVPDLKKPSAEVRASAFEVMESLEQVMQRLRLGSNSRLTL
jgi:HAD superfamily hydrolase (TIGR01509 family)